MVSLLYLLFPGDLFGAQTKSTASGPQQSAYGKNMSYQEGSKDRITHTESSGFHFIEIHQGTVGAMLTLLIVFGLLLCCMRFLRFQFLRRQQLRNLRERFLRGYMVVIIRLRPYLREIFTATSNGILQDRRRQVGIGGRPAPPRVPRYHLLADRPIRRRLLGRVPHRISLPPSPLNSSQVRPTPARRLKGGFAGVEQDI